MSRPRALVIGGTGATGPNIVEGLYRRGYDVTILHGGQHEVEFGVPDVRHIHADPHFRETLEPVLGEAVFELVLAQYGRLRIIADMLRGRTGRLIAVGAAAALFAPEGDPRWGLPGRPAVFPETSAILVSSAEQNKLRFRMVEAMTYLLEQHHVGAYSATYIGWPLNYGPRQPGPQDWATIRRALDGRGDIVIADGGLKLESRIYTENAAHAILLAVDHPDIAAGKRYAVADENVFSMKQRIQMVAEYMGHQFNFVDMPYAFAWPAHPLWRQTPIHQLSQNSLIRTELGYQDVVPAEVAIKRTVDWLLEHRPEPGGEAERQIGDPFDYPAEDELIERWRRACEAFGPLTWPTEGERTHQYRHPKQPGQSWTDAVADRIPR